MTWQNRNPKRKTNGGIRVGCSDLLGGNGFTTLINVSELNAKIVASIDPKAKPVTERDKLAVQPLVIVWVTVNRCSSLRWVVGDCENLASTQDSVVATGKRRSPRSHRSHGNVLRGLVALAFGNHVVRCRLTTKLSHSRRKRTGECNHGDQTITHHKNRSAIGCWLQRLVRPRRRHINPTTNTKMVREQAP